MLFQAAFLDLVGRLSFFHGVSPGLVLALRPMLRLLELKRGRVLLERGRRQELVWFVVSGTLKEVLAGGRVGWFWSEGDFVFCAPGFFSREAALGSVELVGDCCLLEISYVDFMVLFGEFSEVHPLVERIRGYYEGLRVAHAADLVELSAGERFRKFYKANKALFNVARHKDIASFLGIRDNGFHRYQ